MVGQIGTRMSIENDKVVQMLIDDGKIPAPWIDAATIKTVEDAQRFIDAAVTYIEPEQA